MGKMTRKICVGLFFILIVFFLQTNVAQACGACSGGGIDPLQDESINKALADLRAVYEQKGKNAIPDIRETLNISTDPAVIQMATNYLVDLDDRESIRQMESMLLDLVKRVTFTTFGLNSPGFQLRIAVAHALRRFGPTTVGDLIWEKYDRLDWKRKSEIPDILSALKDPHLEERLVAILNKEKDHQLLQGALEMMNAEGSQQSLPILRSKIEAWADRELIYSLLLTAKANTAISSIKRRWKQDQQ